ncbi:MAG TPA: type II and III secretion system protein family protein [Stellaceae bacterium]|nr:type II and III secretion system protein family protein [Stellaceae bacterium]
MTRLFPRFLIALALAAASLAPLASSAAPKSAAATAATGAPLMVEVGKGQLINIDHPATSVFVADPDVADVQVKSPSLIYIFGKAGGETSLIAVGENDQVLTNMTVRVRLDVNRVADAIHHLVPRSAISVQSIDDTIVLEGTVYSAAEGEDIRRVTQRFVSDPKQVINRMKVEAPNQINLRVRVAEISRELIKQFGFNWDAAFSKGNFVFGLASGPNPTQVAQGIFNTRTLSADAKTTVNNLFGSARVGNTDLNALIDALDSEGIITVLAEPNLTAVSGEQASFLAGGEFPVPVASQLSGGVATITVDWKKFGVSLGFVATIAGNDRISLHVAPEVSELSTTGAVTINNITLPALTTRRADTTVEMASGQSFAIAGLLQNNVNQKIDKFPWLGDVPILGALFRSTSFQRNETELVIIVTPYIVRPVTAANRLMAPTDGYVSPNDRGFVFEGLGYQPQALKHSTMPTSGSGSTLVGPVGFDLD